ncbi:MAG: biopolymer transporter ExbD [Myxococcaceae bacterium]|nr:biopolymer transporter ExbD [Myxococcaceae bacterium]MBH2006177.1 biopolymer transporter ExbD [Myxococcaceae bacterium]
MMRRRRFRSEESPYRVSLTSLMDVVTNILVYTIKIFAVSPIVVQDPSVDLPHSTTRENAEEAVVVMLTGIRRMEGAVSDEMKALYETPTIVVDGRVVEKIDPKTYRVPALAKKNGYVITSLREELISVKANQKHTAEFIKNSGFTGKVVIVADKYTPYRVLVDVLVTCGDAGFGKFEFAVIKQEA